MAGVTKVAFCTPPHYGGIYSVFRRIRAATASHGWDVTAVYTTDDPGRWYGFDAALGQDGVVCAPVGGGDLKAQARALTEWFEANGFRIVIPMSSPPALAAVPHLPHSIQVVTRCINITPHAYRLASWGLPWIDRVVHTSPRQAHDLRRRYRVPAAILSHVPNAVDTSRLAVGRTFRASDQPLRIIFLDRLEHTQKRVFLLPELLRRLDTRGVSFELVVVGDGPEREALANRLQPWVSRGAARFVGAVPNDSVGAYLGEADVLLKVSRSEGFPSSVIEAMAAGVVPVVSRLRGVTDWIVRDGETGILCALDDVGAFAVACERLHRDRGLMHELSQTGARDVVKRFNLPAFGRAWSAVFEQVIQNPRRALPLDWKRFRTPLPFQGTLAHRLLWRHVSRAWKDRARTIAENLSVRR